MRYTLRIAVVAVLLFAGSSFAQQAKQEVKKDGWWLKTLTEKPASQMMAFYVGARAGSYGFWRVWNPGDPVEFDVPEEYRNSPTLYILAQTTSGVKCGFCIMYKSKGVKRIEFDLEQDHEATQSDEDTSCK
ncbi:MAG: hypothetical protein JXA73_12215 [Acidobacteria bacterium]|nr:hypothetical protein [Acidobacteriota bacterium]